MEKATEIQRKSVTVHPSCLHARSRARTGVRSFITSNQVFLTVSSLSYCLTLPLVNVRVVTVNLLTSLPVKEWKQRNNEGRLTVRGSCSIHSTRLVLITSYLQFTVHADSRWEWLIHTRGLTTWLFRFHPSLCSWLSTRRSFHPHNRILMEI